MRAGTISVWLVAVVGGAILTAGGWWYWKWSSRPGALISRPGEYWAPSMDVKARVEIRNHIIWVSLLKADDELLIEAKSGYASNWFCQWSEDGRSFWVYENDRGGMRLMKDDSGVWVQYRGLSPQADFAHAPKEFFDMVPEGIRSGADRAPPLQYKGKR